MKVKYKNKVYEIYKTTYANNGTLALSIYYHKELFSVPTKNLGVTPGPEYQYIDTNNYPWLPDFIEKTGIGEPWKFMVARSGFCTYPMYKFKIDNIEDENEG